ncbi:hypothetical protein Gasu2_54110 [Galdieria sulphuraria]|nr:hypothetical protein Gasu2_54110 [Galdieria sulphuraria]
MIWSPFYYYYYYYYPLGEYSMLPNCGTLFEIQSSNNENSIPTQKTIWLSDWDRMKYYSHRSDRIPKSFFVPMPTWGYMGLSRMYLNPNFQSITTNFSSIHHIYEPFHPSLSTSSSSSSTLEDTNENRKQLRKWKTELKSWMNTSNDNNTQTLLDLAARQLLKRLGQLCATRLDSRRPYCLGIRETMRAIKKSIIQVVLIANYVENTDKMEKLESKIVEMILICKQRNIPYYFVLDVYEMAQWLGFHSKLRKISVMGLVVSHYKHHQHSQDEVELWNDAYQQLRNLVVQETNPSIPSKEENETSMRCSSDISNHMEIEQSSLSAQALPFVPPSIASNVQYSSPSNCIFYFGDIPVSISI